MSDEQPASEEYSFVHVVGWGPFRLPGEKARLLRAHRKVNADKSTSASQIISTSTTRKSEWRQRAESTMPTDEHLTRRPHKDEEISAPGTRAQVSVTKQFRTQLNALSRGDLGTLVFHIMRISIAWAENRELVVSRSTSSPSSGNMSMTIQVEGKPYRVMFRPSGKSSEQLLFRSILGPDELDTMTDDDVPASDETLSFESLIKAEFRAEEIVTLKKIAAGSVDGI